MIIHTNMLILQNTSSLVHDLINKSDVTDILHNALNSKSLGLNECVRLFKSNDIYPIALVSNTLRQRLYGNTATFVNNIILNYTNVCITYCKFCAFYLLVGHEEAYTLSLDVIVKRVLVAREMFGITQVLIQLGHNPNFNLVFYEEALKTRKKYNYKYAE